MSFYYYLCLMKSGLCNLIEKYCNLVLALEDDEDFSPQWLCFYRIQMASWIMQMSGHCDNLTQIHEVYTRIKDAWCDIDAYLNEGKFNISDQAGLFKTIDLHLEGKYDPQLRLVE